MRTLAVNQSELVPDEHLLARCPRDIDPFTFTVVPNLLIMISIVKLDSMDCKIMKTGLSGRTLYGMDHLCSRCGWFHREIALSRDNIEITWCADQENC